MAKENPFYKTLKHNYLFETVQQKIDEQKSPTSLINLGIGDIALPLIPSVSEAISDAAKEMTKELRGYGPSCGYDFLRTLIAENDYTSIEPEEIFISDGINREIINILELFDIDNQICMTDPSYPVYYDGCVMEGREKYITLLPETEENNFSPSPPEKFDIAFVCSPNNPTGVALDKDKLQKWVDAAISNQAIILYDNAYGAFIESKNVPKSIYEIDGAKKCAIEFRSFSKSAGFSGLRCGYTTVPLELGNIHSLWKRRCATISNGTSYPIQKGAAALYSKEGKIEVQKQIASYKKVANLLLTSLTKMGFTCYGGDRLSIYLAQNLYWLLEFFQSAP